MRFGERLWMCPSWRPVPDSQAVNVMLDLGLAFGTGTHPSTALCLQWLDCLDLRVKTVIDFGCGSGILAIAALNLGAAHAVGIDIDPQDRHADVVVANILAGPIGELSPLIMDLPRPCGYLGLSSILASQAESVAHAYTAAFALDPLADKNEWCRITGTRP